MADVSKLPTAENAVALVREVMEREGAYAAEVTALGVCVAVVERLPKMLQTRVVNHLHKMFEGYESLTILTAMVSDAASQRERADGLASALAQAEFKLELASKRLGLLRDDDKSTKPLPPSLGASA